MIEHTPEEEPRDAGACNEAEGTAAADESKDDGKQNFERVKEGFSKGAEKARDTARKVAPKLRKALHNAAFGGAYGASYGATFGATLLKELFPKAMKDGFCAGFEDGKAAADKVRTRREETDAEEVEVVSIDEVGGAQPETA